MTLSPLKSIFNLRPNTWMDSIITVFNGFMYFLYFIFGFNLETSPYH